MSILMIPVSQLIISLPSSQITSAQFIEASGVRKWATKYSLEHTSRMLQRNPNSLCNFVHLIHTQRKWHSERSAEMPHFVHSSPPFNIVAAYLSMDRYN